MKKKVKYIFLMLTLQLILLAGCAEANNKAYQEAMNSGLEEIRIENYKNAEEYFRQALEEEPKDIRAETLMKQTKNYIEAVHFFEQKEYDKAIERAKLTQSLENGSKYLKTKSVELIENIQCKQDEQSDAKQKEDSLEEVFEQAKGFYAVFARKNYEWPVDYLFIIGDDFIIDGYQQTGLEVSEIVNKMFDGNNLYLHTFTEERSSNKEVQHIIEISYNSQNKKTLHLDTGEVLYPITLDDAIKTSFGNIEGMTSIINDLEIYDREVPQKVSYSNTSFLNNYSAKDIEYARVWLNVIGNKGVTELHVSKEKEGNIINHYDADSPVYPEDVTVLTGLRTADGMVVYSSNGDGTINIYRVPSHWHTPDEDLPELYEEILNPKTIYLEPMKDEEVINLINKINYP